MDKAHFNSLILHLSDASHEDVSTLLALKSDYPYSQLLHALAARVSKDHGLNQQQAELQLAAVYANDRSVLKEIMTMSFENRKSSPHTIIEKGEPVAPGIQETKLIIPHTEPESSYDIADAVIHDLEKLHESRHKFEMLFLEGAESTSGHPVADQNSITDDLPKGKSKKERIKELAKALQTNAEQSKADIHVKPESSIRKKDGPVDSLLEEIQTSKQEIAPVGEKQKEQLQIIEQFIKVQPNIVNTKEKQAAVPPGDLSTIRSGEFGDHIISETLVEILLKQGKKDKAIEVLKKLIWKFPQKKAYFAAQIEELKK